jgi:4,5-dihydroxyphthalate decarboxylase
MDQKRGIYPINHIVSIRKQLLIDHQWLARELTEIFEAARTIAPPEGAAAPPQYGLEPNRDSLQLVMDYSFRQGVTRRAFSVNEIFHTPAH